MAERQIEHRKSSLVLSALFPVVKWRSCSNAKSAYWERERERERGGGGGEGGGGYWDMWYVDMRVQGLGLSIPL